MIMSSRSPRPLSAVPTAMAGVVDNLDGDEATRRVLLGLGFVPGAKVEMMRAAAAGPMTIRIGEARLAIDRRLADRVLVT